MTLEALAFNLGVIEELKKYKPYSREVGGVSGFVVDFLKKIVG